MNRFIILICLLALLPATAAAQGYPAIRNFTAEEYGAHNRNFDMTIGEDGTVFVANFEGLLYYDRAQWRMIHTSDLHRLTVVFRAKDNTIWAGGYNYLGRLQKKSNGELYLERVGRPDLFRGEVMEIFETDGDDDDDDDPSDDVGLQFFVSDGCIYEIKGNNALLKRNTGRKLVEGLESSIIEVDKLKEKGEVEVLRDVVQTERIDNGLQVMVRRENGLEVTDRNYRSLFTLKKENGLCSDNIAYVGYDGYGEVWGATDHGIFAIELPSVYSYFLPKDGLMGNVLSIEEYGGRVYVGTIYGLFWINGKELVRIDEVKHGCWTLKRCSDGLLAATSNGIYLLAKGGGVQHLTNSQSTSMLVDGHDIYSGQPDGVYRFQIGGVQPQKVCDMVNVTKMLKDGKGAIWLQNMYGEIYCKQAGDEAFRFHKANGNRATAGDGEQGTPDDIAATIVQTGNQVTVVNALATKPFVYPAFSHCDETGVTWLTDNEGKHLYQWKDGKRLTAYDHLLFPVGEMVVSALFRQGNLLWIGGDNILTVIDMQQKQPARFANKPQLLFRSIVMNSDSVLWGGYGDMPDVLPQLDSDERNLRFVYTLNYAPLTGQTLYRYKLNNDEWSAWTKSHEARFLNLPYGSYTLTVQARLANGELSDTASVEFSIAFPFYMRWYMLAVYVLLFILLVFAFFRLRLKRLSQEKMKLERIVQERTSEVVKQKDEIEEKSRSLEKALEDLGNAQHELIRQEKMATVGKLTQGLIDRILNPLNYINNFAKLSEGLVKDVEADIEEGKDKMDQECYEDAMDVLDMLMGNLHKVSEHGQNTTRTLKAMEEMLKDRSGGIVPMDLIPVLRQDKEMLTKYYAEDMAKYGIRTTFDVPQDTISINGNADQLSKTLMSILGNAVYAVVKKAQREHYTPEISVAVGIKDEQVDIVIRDNGIGIEPTIIHKVFDPFFTTKTTAEAAGVGLYLSREIVQNHGGDISVKSEKNVYTEFTIQLPTLHTGVAYGKTN